MPLKNGRQISDLQTILVGSVIPPGTIQSFGGQSVPTGWLLCDGSTVSRSTYSALFDAIGTVHGQGNGSTTFHLPDLRGRFLRGADSMGTGAAGRDPDNVDRTAANSGGATGRNVIFSEGFESGNFTANGWTVLNGTQTNKFIVGTATKNSGTYSAYISNNNSSNAYTAGAASVVWFYKDITLGSDTYELSFNYKQDGENGWDRGRVIIDPTLAANIQPGTVFTATPSGGSNTILTDQTNTWVSRTISLSSYKNQTIRVIFGWKNDASLGTNPPIAIDDISIYGSLSTGSVQDSVNKSHTHLQNTHGHAARYDAQLNADSDATGGIMVNSDNDSNYSAHTGSPSATLGDQIGGTIAINQLDGNLFESRPQNLACSYIIKV